MKKLIWTLSLLLVLVLATVPALAATYTANVDGKDYIFYGDQSVFEADGKTFIVEGNTMRIQEPGKQDRVLPLESSTEAAVDRGTNDGRSVSTAVEGDVATAASEEGISAAISETSQTTYAAISQEIMEGTGSRYDIYSRYAEHGLSYDAATDILYYQGQRVRIFTDAYPIDASGYAAVEHCDLAGVIDVEAQRDLTKIQYNGDGSYDPGGTLTGLRVWTGEEFARRDLTPWTSPLTSTVAISEGGNHTPAEKAAFYAPYAEVGVTYDAATDQLFYLGKSVRNFQDVRQSNGASMSGGLFKGVLTQFTNDAGEIDISILRDYASPDAQGDGKIVGVRVENE